MTKRLAVLLSVLFVSVVAYAAVGVRGAKGSSTFTSTTVQAITTTPTAVYSVILGTGAVTDYTVLVDSANATGIAVASVATTGFKGRVYPSSTTQNTQVTFDPPLQFNNGLTAASATANTTVTITYESGRVSQGY